MDIAIAVLVSVLISACITKITAEYYTREILSLIDVLEEGYKEKTDAIMDAIRRLVDKLSKR